MVDSSMDKPSPAAGESESAQDLVNKDVTPPGQVQESSDGVVLADSVSGESAAVSKWHWHRRLYNWVLHWANTPYGGPALFVLAFAESSFFPVPPDVLLAPLTLGNRSKWWKFALSCSLASVVGGICGYLIGMFLWNSISGWAYVNLSFVGLTEANFTKFEGWYKLYDFWIVFTCGFTPLPYKVCTISAGMVKISFLGFIIASTVSRSVRFFLVAGLFWKFGPTIKPFIDKYFNWLCLLFMVLLIGGFLVLKYL